MPFHQPPAGPHRLILLLATLALTFASDVVQAQASGESLPAYSKSGSLSGRLQSIGSETMEAVIALWAEEFSRFHPAVSLGHESTGSGAVPAALKEGRARLGAMSRPMKTEELADFERAKGYKPLEIRVATDAIAIFVAKDNPIRGLTLADLKTVFTNTAGGNGAKVWGDLGLPDDWASKPIHPFGRDAKSGTFGYFQEIALNGGEYHPKVVAMPGPKSTVKAIGTTPGAIGYASPEAATSRVRVVAIGRTADKFVDPNSATCMDRSYPLSRFLYFYVDRKPGTAPSAEVGAFLQYVLSREGQACAAKAGLVPLSAAAVQEERRKLN